MKKITKHGKKRIKERVETDKTEESLIKLVRKNGKSKERYQGNLYDYLTQKCEKGAKVKIYKENIYVLSKNSKRLITVYPIPEKYKPCEQFEISINKSTILYFPYKYINKQITLTLENEMQISGILQNLKFENDKAITYFLKQYDSEQIIEIPSCNISNLSLDFEKMSFDLFNCFIN